MNNTDSWLGYTVYGKPAPIGPSWIDLAVKQKNERVTVGLACSVPLTYNDLDKVALQKQKFN